MAAEEEARDLPCPSELIYIKLWQHIPYVADYMDYKGRAICG